MLPLTLLFWVPAVFAAYYAVHKPLPANLTPEVWALLSQPGTGAPFTGALLDIAAATWLTAAATGAGLLLLSVILHGGHCNENGARWALVWERRHLACRAAGILPAGGGAVSPSSVVAPPQAGMDDCAEPAAAGMLPTMVFAAALGLGALSLATFAIGILGFLAPVPAFFLLGLFTGATVLCVRRLRHCEEPATAGRPKQSGKGELVSSPVSGGGPPPAVRRPGFLHATYCILLTLTAVLTLSQALVPPTAWDSLVYHLTGPKRYIAAGQIAGGLDIPHVYFPGVVEQLFTAAMLVRGEITAQLMHFALAGVAVLAVFAFLDQRHGRRAAWLGAALMASAPSLAALARVSYVEWGVITFGFLAFWALQEALERDSRRWLLLSGCLGGLAMGTKYTAAFLLLGIALPLIVRPLRPSTQSSPPLRLRVREGGPRRAALTDLTLWCVATGVVASPWFLRNLTLTGNPVYPFFFDGWNWDSWKADWFSRTGTGLATEPWRLLIAPWDLTVLSVQGGGAYDVDLGPLFLALAPLLLLRCHNARWAGHALVAVAVIYGGWLTGIASSSLLLQGRLLLPILPFLACLLAVSLDGGGLPASSHPGGGRRASSPALPGGVEGSSPPLRGRVREGGTTARPLTLGRIQLQSVLQASVLLALALSVLAHTARWVADPPLPYLLRKESREAYLERHLGEHYRALASLPADGNTLFLWEPRSYLCRAACQPDALLYNWRYLLHRHGTPDRVANALRREGYTHVLLYGGGLRFFGEGPRPEVGPEHVQALQDLESRHLDRLYGPALAETLQAPLETLSGRVYALYSIK